MSVATTFVHDTFTEPDNSLMLLHQPEVGGPVKLLSSYPGSLSDPPTCTGTVNGVISYWILSNRAYPNGTGGGTNVGVYYDATPGSADYDLYFTLVVPNPFSSDSYHGVLFRVNTSNGDHYRLSYWSFSGFKYWHLHKRVSGVESSVGSNASQTLTAGATYRYRLNVAGTTFTLTDITAGSPGTTIGTWTDSSLSSAGKVGLWAQGNTASVAFDEFRACNAGTSAEDYTLDAPAWPSQPRGIPGAQSGNFTVTLQGSNAGPVTITPGASGVPGTFSPTTVTLSGLGASGTFKFTPSALTSVPSTATVACSNNAGLNDPGTVSYTVDYFDLYGKSVWVDGATNSRIGPANTGPNYPTDPTSNSISSNDQYQGLRDVYRVVQSYVGGTAFNRSIDVSRLSYRNTYGASAGGQIGQIYNYAWYALNDWVEHASIASREFAILTARWTPYAVYSPSSLALYVDNSSSQMRETAYCVLSKCLVSRLGYPPPSGSIASVHRFTQSLLTLLDDYMLGPGNRTVNNATSQFFVGLAFQALIAYWNHYINDAGTAISDTLNPGQTVLQLAQSIPAKIKQTVDWMMSPSRSQAISGVANNGSGLYRLTVPDTSNWTTGKKVLVLSTGISALDNKLWTVTVVDGTHLDLQGSTYASGWTSGGTVNPLEWDSAKQTFAYRDDTPTDSVSPTAIDYTTWKLNGDFIGGSAWYYQWSARVNGSREPAYRDYAEKIFRGSYPVALQGTDHGCASSNKEWTEMYYQMPAALNWVSQGDQAWTAATGLSLTQPAATSGAPGQWSGPYVVSLTGTGSQFACTPTTVSPSDGGAGGTFSPTRCNISTDFPTCAFRYRPASGAAGTNVSLSFSASGLTGTGTATYAVGSTPAATATGIAISGPTTATTGQWTAYTIALTPAGSVSPTSADTYGGVITVYLTGGGAGGYVHMAGDNGPTTRGDGGRFVTLSADTPSVTFWFKPPSAGGWNLAATVQEGPVWSIPTLGVTASGTASLGSIAMSGPSAGFVGRVSDLFNLVPNGTGTSSVTLSDGGAGGTFLPSSTVRWINEGTGYGGTYQPGAVAAFAYQAPASAGDVTISATATGASSPSPLTYSASESGGSPAPPPAPPSTFVLQNGPAYYILAN